MSESCNFDACKIRPDFFKGDGLVPVVVQDFRTGQVLMLAYMNEESYEETLRLGYAVFYSRSRKKLWRKGEESGNVQKIHEVFIDCDCDTLLLKVEQIGGSACHEGYPSCFFRKLEGNNYVVVEKRVFDPSKVYKN